jgi:hypothetical protein
MQDIVPWLSVNGVPVLTVNMRHSQTSSFYGLVFFPSFVKIFTCDGGAQVTAARS